ncbi:MAG TPA: hypothetical protein VF885_20480 [Arthrobacter sp.]
MAQQKSGESRNLRTSVKGPLMFSAFWAVVAFVATLIFASGGTAKTPRLDLAFIAAGIAFIVILVVLAMLSMGHKPNAEHLGKGSGVNLSSRNSGHGGHPARSQPEAGGPATRPEASGPDAAPGDRS